MINANDLRIGNWVEHNANWCYRSPAEIKPFKFQWEERDWYAVGECTMSLEDLHPIPLTPEVLEKAGFILMNKVTQRFKKYINETDSECICLELSEVGNNKPYRVMYDYNAGTYLKQKVLYLHDLQNLYRYLTGTELTLNICTATTQNGDL